MHTTAHTPIEYLERSARLFPSKTAVIDLCAGKRPPAERLAPASLYLDLTSDSKKQEFFREKRPDIPYQSVRNYLDTVMKARYNAI